MKKLIVVILVVIGILTILAVALGLGVGFAQRLVKGTVPDKTILRANFERGFIEYVPDDPLGTAILQETPTMLGVVEALERASEDERVVGLIARVGAASLGAAQIQEIRDAILRFRKSGKPAVAYSETFGEAGPGNDSYYLATAFGEIYMQPSGDIGLTGLIAESPFLRGTLDKLGLVPRGDHRYEYKNALNLVTERKYTAPHREATAALLDSMFGQMVEGIAEARSLSEDEVRALIDRGPFFGQEAVEAKLVDGLAYRDEIYDQVKEKAGEGAELLALGKYLDRAGGPFDEGETFALIYGVGGVSRGKSEYDPFSESTNMGSDTVAGAFRAAIDDDDVKAIIFRVDSPGGSYVASDTIWHETVRARDAGKPVIVTMGNLAASGGYFVSMGAEKIVAQPGTITGSIGVVFAKFLTPGFWEKTGISWDEVHTSENANYWTGLHDYTPEQWSRLQNWLDRIYDDFTSKVADGRNLPKEKVLEIAKGRIWTGEDAHKLGLVDEVGGFAQAIALARQEAGIDPDADIRLRRFPKKKPVWQLFMERRSGSDEAEALTLALARAGEIVGPLAELARQVGIAPEQGVLRMPEAEQGW
jgi:protease-4